jgi:hypothetical protein
VIGFIRDCMERYGEALWFEVRRLVIGVVRMSIHVEV